MNMPASKEKLSDADLLNEESDIKDPTDEPKDPKQKITKEDAQLQLDLYFNNYEIYIEDIDSESARSIIQTTSNRVRRAIMNGHVEMEQKGEELIVRQHMFFTEAKSTFTYGEIDGRISRQMDKVGHENQTKRFHSILSLTSKVPIHEFSLLKKADASISENLGALFLLV